MFGRHSRKFISWLFVLLISSQLLADKPQKFFIVIHENANIQDVLKQPFYKNLTQQGTLFTNYYGVTHPSQPNYWALAAGSTFGVTDDQPHTIDAPTIATLLDAKGVSWKLYIENWPGDCFMGQFGDVYLCPGSCVPCTTILGGPIFSTYRRSHNPLISFSTITPAQCAKIVDASEFYDDVVNNTVPDFAFYVPNSVNDAHDTNLLLPVGLAYSDRSLQYEFTLALANKCFTKDRVFAVIFDESLIDEPNHIYAVFVGPNVKRNHQVDTEYNHYNLLRTIEDNFDLGTLGQNDATSSPMTGWQK